MIKKLLWKLCGIAFCEKCQAVTVIDRPFHEHHCMSDRLHEAARWIDMPDKSHRKVG